MIVPSITNQYLIFIPIIGLGIAWASIIDELAVGCALPSSRNN